MSDLYERLVEFTGDGVYRYTFDEGRLLFGNRGLVRILDLDCGPEDLNGRLLKDLMVYTEKEGTVRRTIAEHREIHGFEYHFRTLKGEDRWVIHDSFITDDLSGASPVIEAIVKDITARKRGERELAAERERLAVTLNSIGDAVIATDVEGRVVLMNPVAERLTGWTQREAGGRILADIFHIINERTRRACRSPVERVLKHGHTVGLANHTALIARDGSERSIADSGSPIRDKDGRVIGVVLVFRDITESRRAEDQLKKSLAEKEVLLKEIHHRVKNNLQIISSLLHLQSGFIKDKRALEVVRECSSRVKTMALIHERLYQSKDLAQVDFAEYVQHLAAQLLTTYGTTPGAVRAKIEVQEKLSLGIQSAIPCALIINELVSNALKHAFPNGAGEVCVRLRLRPDRMYELIVADNGVGLPESFDISRSPTLGLQLVRTLAEQLSGRIGLTRREGTQWEIVFE